MSLDDICEMVTDGTHASFKDSGKGFPFLTVKDMTENGLDFSGCIHISQEEYDRADAGNSAPKLGDVLFSKDGTVGKVCVVREKREFAVLSSIAILRPKKEIADSSYLGYILGFQKTIDEASKRKTGSAVRRIILKDLKQVEIPLPPLEEQQRIAAILDKADGVRRKRKEAIRLTEELLRSTFLEMFGDPVILGGKYPLIQTGDVANSKGVIKKYTQTYSDKGLAQSRMWPAGTLCITIAANIAQTGILTFDSCFPDSIVGFKPNNRVTTEYIQAWLGFLQPRLEDLAPQSAQKNINLQMLRELDVPVPPVDLQSKFSEFVKRIGNNSRNYEKSEAVIDNLFNSLLQKAFRGEL